MAPDQMHDFHIEISLEQPPTATTTPVTSRVPATTRERDSSTRSGKYYDPDKRPDEFTKMIRNYSINNGIELDPRFDSRSEDHSRTYRIARRRRHAGSSSLTSKEQLDGPYTIHCFEDNWGSLRAGHTSRSCRLFIELSDRLKEKKQRKAK